MDSVLESETYKLPWGLEIETDHIISARRPDLVIIKKKKKKRNCQIVDFSVLADHRIELKVTEKRDKYLDLASELKKKLWNMKVTMIPIVIGALGIIPKGLAKRLDDLEIRGQVKTIPTTAILRSARILKRVLGT